jgi:hypothetical protein
MISKVLKKTSLLEKSVKYFSAGPYNPHKYKHHLVPKNMMKYINKQIIF